MKSNFIKTAAAGFLTCLVFIAAVSAQGLTKPRYIMMHDMGNERDEEQQQMHEMMFYNLFDVEGLIAITGMYLNPSLGDNYHRILHSELYDTMINNYEKIYPNLQKHASGWPTPAYLRSVRKSGQTGYGSGDVGAGKSSAGSNLIMASITKNDPRPLYIIANAGSNTLAQALFDLKNVSTQAQMDAFCRKIIVFENGAQDDCGALIMHNYPLINWYRSNTQTYGYGGETNNPTSGPYCWEPYAQTATGQHQWAHTHIVNGHGPLGAKYPDRDMGGLWYLDGGGIIPWTGLVDRGLCSIFHFEWGGFSGRFPRTKSLNVASRHGNGDLRNVAGEEVKYRDYYMYDADACTETWTDPVYNKAFSGHYVPVWRWRRAMWNDFRARMDWCLNDYANANHNPVALVNGDTLDTVIVMTAAPGQHISFDASASKDPDKDSLKFNWFIYKEAGTYTGTIVPTTPFSSQTSISIPSDANGKDIHLILEVRDSTKIVDVSGHPNMYDYRRIVINVSSTGVSNSNSNKRFSNRSAMFFTTGEKLVLPLEFREHACRLAVYDLSGKCVRRVVVKQGAISLSKQLSLAPGAYIAKINSK